MSSSSGSSGGPGVSGFGSWYLYNLSMILWLGGANQRASIATIKFCTLHCLFLIDSIGHATNINVPCFFSQSNNGTSTLNLSPYLNIIPYTLYELSYLILSISLIEFIIAQSPHSMKGVLIGFYYVLRFGLGRILILTEFLASEKHPACLQQFIEQWNGVLHDFIYHCSTEYDSLHTHIMEIQAEGERWSN